MFDEYTMFKNHFKNAMDNNLNTSLAITCLYDVLKSNMNDYTKYKLISEFDTVLSLDLTKKEEITLNISEDEINDLIEKRNAAKKNKDYALADKIRDELLEQGIKLIDTREGTTYEIIKD